MTVTDGNSRFSVEFGKQYTIDPERIYPAGHSAGAIESYEPASALSGLFSAIAPFSVDGDFFTRWSSAWTDNETLTLDLGEEYIVSGITLLWEQAFAGEYAIELSDDGTVWSEAVHRYDGQCEIEFLPIPDIEACFVRFRGIRRATEWGYSFWEVFVYGE